MANTKIPSELITDDAITSAHLADNSVGITALNVSDGTDGQALVTNGSGTLSFASVGVTGISSSADATAITINSSEQVGINVSPDTLFHVSKTGSGDKAKIGNGTRHGFIAVDSSGVSFGNEASQAGELLYLNEANGYASIFTGGSERLRIDSTGKVGIKVAAPSEALHIEGNTTAGGNNYIYLRKSDQASNQGIYIGQATNNNDLKILQRANNAIVFQNTTSETERLRIDEAGLIRINQAASYDCGKLIVYGGSSSGTNGGTLHYNGTSRQYTNCVSSHTAASGHRWWNVKTNIQATDYVMYVARVHGYGYGNSGATVDIYRSGYAHSSTGTFAGQSTKNNGSSSDTLVAYYSSDEYVCFKHEMPSSGYYSGLAFDIAMYSPTGYNFDFEVLGNAWSTTSSNYY